ncbi:MAG: hypothetical protein K8S56_05780 [Candidatus Cloacimonetes bacterium]|nr:hypothetical protein [Candidatus Cloacimonadota bacterium]
MSSLSQFPKQKRYISLFEKIGATNKHTAQSLMDMGLTKNKAFKGLRRNGVLESMGDGRYYLHLSSKKRFYKKFYRDFFKLSVMLGTIVGVLLWVFVF